MAERQRPDLIMKRHIKAGHFAARLVTIPGSASSVAADLLANLPDNRCAIEASCDQPLAVPGECHCFYKAAVPVRGRRKLRVGRVCDAPQRCGLGPGADRQGLADGENARACTQALAG